jgi:hypothetical protein
MGAPDDLMALAEHAGARTHRERVEVVLAATVPLSVPPAIAASAALSELAERGSRVDPADLPTDPAANPKARQIASRVEFVLLERARAKAQAAGVLDAVRASLS